MKNKKHPRKIKHIYIGNRVYEVVNGFTERKKGNENEDKTE